MANNINEFDTTAGSNTDIGGVSIAEGMSPGSVNDALRMLCAHLANAFNNADPAVKLNGVKTAKLTIADDTDEISVGSTNPTTISHVDADNKTTVAAPRKIEIQIGDGSNEGTFTINEFDSTLGEIEVLKQTSTGGLVVGNDNLNTQRAADTTWRTMTVKGGLQADKFYGDGSGLTGVGSADGATPVGLIAMWSGTLASIPTGWQICDGTGGTPDLRDKFVVGAAAGANPGASGGANSLTLTEAQMPAHTHGAGTIGQGHTHSLSNISASHDHDDGSLQVNSHQHTIGPHQHSVNYQTQTVFVPATGSARTLVTGIGSGSSSATVNASSQYNSGSANPNVEGSTANANLTLSGSTNAASSLSGQSGSKGSGSAIDNRPAFYSLAFIMFTGA